MQEAIYAKSIADTGALAVGGTSTLQQVNAEATNVKSLTDTNALTVGGTSTLQQVNAEATYTKSLLDSNNLTVGGNSYQEAIYAKSIADTGALTVGGTIDIATSEFRGELRKEPLRFDDFDGCWELDAGSDLCEEYRRYRSVNGWRDFDAATSEFRGKLCKEPLRYATNCNGLFAPLGSTREVLFMAGRMGRRVKQAGSRGEQAQKAAAVTLAGLFR